MITVIFTTCLIGNMQHQITGLALGIRTSDLWMVPSCGIGIHIS